MTTESVRAAAAAPDLNHRDPEYLSLIRETKERLLGVYPQTRDGWHPYLLGGSGTLAVEAMITSVIEKGPVLVLENGYYSSRIRSIFEIHGIPFKALTYGWLERWDFDEINSELALGYEAVIGTHNETTTGRLNDIGRLGGLCRRHGVISMIDAMSSFGADPIDFSGLDVIALSGNKCLHAIPGVAIILLREALAPGLARVPRRSYYMSLPQYAGDAPPLTPPVPALAALRQALREMPEGGAEGRRRVYAERAQFLRNELVARGLHTPVAFDELSCALSTFAIPSGWSFDAWFEANSEAGYLLYACKGDLRDRYFQVANMGELPAPLLQGWLDVVDRLLGH